MHIVHWLAEEWAHLSENLGVFALVMAIVSLRREAKIRRVETYFRVVENHREIWMHLYSRPELTGVRDPKRDTAICPPTDEEVHSVNFLLFHLNGVLLASKAGIIPKPERLADDVRAFFSLPVPRFAWLRLRESHDREFVAFMDRSLGPQSSKS